MNAIRSVLRHRAAVSRASTQYVDGTPVQVWAVVESDLPCLLDAGTLAQPEPTYSAVQQQMLDRSGLLLTLPTANVKPGDRLTLTRGQSGRFVVKPDPSLVSTFHGPSHREHRVEETP